MIKKILLLAPLLLFKLTAQEEIVITPEQSSNLQIKTALPEDSALLPLGEYVGEVRTPPSLLHTISLPFEARVQTVHATTHQEVNSSMVLATVTGIQWIEVQQKAIADAIEFKHHQHLTQRKNMLCKEDIIPKKECVSANAELKIDKIKVMASKAMLKSYGADDTMIATLFETFTLFPAMEIKSTVSGSITQSQAMPGKSISGSEALFVIQKKGSLWLETSIEAHRSQNLKVGQKVQIQFGKLSIDTSILDIASVINPQNQTRSMRFLLPNTDAIASGLRSTVKISLIRTSLKVTKESVTKEDGKTIVFIQTKNGFRSVVVEILAEDESSYYLKPSPEIYFPIAITSVASLKNVLGGKDE